MAKKPSKASTTVVSQKAVPPVVANLLTADPHPKPLQQEIAPFNPVDAFSHPLLEVTQSSITMFNECPQKFVFRYMMRLGKSGKSNALLVGAAVHEALEYLLDPEVNKKVPPAQRALKAQAIVHKYFDDYVEHSDLVIGANMEAIDRCRQQTLAIIDAWVIVNADWPDRFEVLKTEFNIRSIAKKHDDPWVDRLAGKIDGLVLTSDTGQLYILEHKTRFSLKDFNFVSGLDLDQQTLFYAMLYQVWLERQAVPMDRMGDESFTFKHNGKTINMKLPSGFYYDAMAKPQHRAADTPDGLRDKMVRAMVADPSKYFVFIPIDISTDMVAWARRNFEITIREIDALRPGNIRKNLKSCSAYGGCPYQVLCKAGADANDPAQVMALPESALFNILPLHSELSEDMEAEEISF